MPRDLSSSLLLNNSCSNLSVLPPSSLSRSSHSHWRVPGVCPSRLVRPLLHQISARPAIPPSLARCCWRHCGCWLQGRRGRGRGGGGVGIGRGTGVCREGRGRWGRREGWGIKRGREREGDREREINLGARRRREGTALRVGRKLRSLSLSISEWTVQLYHPLLPPPLSPLFLYRQFTAWADSRFPPSPCYFTSLCRVSFRRSSLQQTRP